MYTFVKHPAYVFLAILALSCLVSPAAARSTSAQLVAGDVSPSPSPTVIEPHEFETFVDGFMKDAMAEYHIPGVTFVAVKDGEIHLLKGYGFADLEGQVPVDPQRHVFRVASTSKLFVATAIMQLYERGQIGLNDDVNKYLNDFQIPEDGLGPITFADLLTHSGGLEGAIENRTDQASAYVPLETYISRHHPRRNAPAGETIEYSNLGYDLLGYLVQEISGQPFAEYVEQNLLRPLAMNRSTFQQVLPDRLAGDVAQRYEFANGAFSPLGLMYINETPAGGLYSTAQDMAAFMIAHLQDGNYQDAHILSPATAQLMHAQHVTNHPGIDGWAYGFYVHNQNGQRLLLHAGDTQAVAAQLALLPDQHIGIFFAVNGIDAAAADLNPVDFRVAFLNAFLNHYYPLTGPSTPPARLAAAADSIDRYAGYYRRGGYSHTGAMKFLTFIPNQVMVEVKGDRLVYHATIGLATEYVEVAPLLFQQVDGSPNWLAFREDQSGRVTHLFVELVDASFTYERIAWYEIMYAMLLIFAFELVVFFSAMLAWPVGALIRRWRKQPPLATPIRSARWIGWLLSTLALLALASWVIMAVQGWTNGTDPLTTNRTGLLGTLVAVHVAVLLAIAMPYFTWLAWRERQMAWTARIHSAFVVLAGLVFVWLAVYWNWLGFRLY